ncbi:MAG: MATE family efflux transporter [Lachnospiraceae bacterium]|nr:MATE family efflux transporter [Lachnospiraceae bacterium]
MDTEDKVRGKNVKETLRMAWPAVCESFFVALAGMVDSLMVSSIGSYAVAAVGLTTQPKFMGMALFIAMNVSISALVARRRGEQKKKEANRILLAAVLFILVSAVVISTLCVTFANQIIRFCGSAEDTHDTAVIYFRIIMGGMIFNVVSMGINAAQRGAGNTIIAMRTNITSNVVNIIGNYLLINGNLGFPALGIRGAAIATVFGTMVACVMSICSLLKKDNFVSIPYIIKEKIKPAAAPLVSIIKVGYSVFIEQVLMRVGFMSTAMMAAGMGTDAMAAHQVGMNILSLTFSFGDGMQVAAVALIGRSLGEGSPDRAKEYGRICRRIGMCISIALAVIYFLGGETLYRLFFEEDNIVAYGVQIIHVIIIIVLFQVSQVIYMGCLRGAGDTAYTAVASTISVTLIRTGFSYLCGIVLGWGIAGIWLGILADQISRYLFASIRFQTGKWTKIKI